MKILMVSMNSIHFVRWTQQLENSGHEVFWFDILDGGRAEGLSWVHQITGWKQRYSNFKGRYFFKKKLPFLYKKLSFLFEYNTGEMFEKVLEEIKPDVVHSMVLYISCTPILKVMKKKQSLPWIYSSWGSDLYYFRNIDSHKRDILKVLPRVDYLITDCKRDVSIAKELGFKGTVLGVFPGGGGFDYKQTDKYIKSIFKRKTILVKGYQGRSGRAIEVLNGLKQISTNLKGYEVVVFGADKEVENYIKEEDLSSELQIKVFSRSNFLQHHSVLKLMGKALIYIGNSNSDGMPNTLLESISQGAFPIQSNPGGVSSEIISHGENGLLIEDSTNSEKIKELIIKAITDSELIEKAFQINQKNVKPQFERILVKTQVLKAYDEVLKR